MVDRVDNRFAVESHDEAVFGLFRDLKSFFDSLSILTIRSETLTISDNREFSSLSKFGLMLTGMREGYVSRHSFGSSNMEALDFHRIAGQIKAPSMAFEKGFHLHEVTSDQSSDDRNLSSELSAWDHLALDAYVQSLKPFLPKKARLQVNVGAKLVKVRRTYIDPKGRALQDQRDALYNRIFALNEETQRGLGMGSIGLGGFSRSVESENVFLSELDTPRRFLRIRSGHAPVILCPNVVALLCLQISNHCSEDSTLNSTILSSLPESFELMEDPFLLESSRRVIFDDEGVPTSRKTLVKKNHQTSSLRNLVTARRLGIEPTGNGFRRGAFHQEEIDTVPDIRPSVLRLLPGTLSLSQMMGENESLIVIDGVSMPYSSIYKKDSFSRSYQATGRLYQGGKYFGHCSIQPSSNLGMVSANPPGSHGSFLDPSAELLKEGKMLDSGWFPFLFLPRFTW